METIDDDVTERTIEFIKKAHAAGKPFFVWWNATHMHLFTHIPKEAQGLSGQGFYNDAMVLHDQAVGRLLDLLDELGIADDTIVLYSTDNGPHYNSWPDAGITPFRSEKNTNWEGGWRVPAFVRWPGKFKAGTVLNGIVCHQDWLPTLLAAAGDPDIKAKLLKGHKAGGKSFRVFIDGMNMLPYLGGEVQESPRNYFGYINDDGRLVALRAGDWKIVFEEQRAKQLACWAEPFVHLRLPKMFHLRRDPFERADENSNSYYEWLIDHLFFLQVSVGVVEQLIASFKEFPPRQKPVSFNLDQIMEQLKEASGGGPH
jgi:arylsulfatase